MKGDKIEQLKKEYMDVPIPEELDFIVRRALKEKGVDIMKRKNKVRKSGLIAASVAGALFVLTVTTNSSPAIAETLSKVPVLGSIVKVVTFREYNVKEDTYRAEIKTPAVEGLDNKTLENSLNQKYLEENKKLYEEFNANMKSLKENGGGHLGVNSGYVVKTDNDRIFSIGRYVVNTVGSSSTTFKYDTIDKKQEVLITLPSLFKDDSYISIISENIKKQMIEQNKADSNKIYWVEGIKSAGNFPKFEKISKDQNFYINAEGKLVISFNKYDIAPGVMGIVEFTIPTDIIKNILVGTEYIK